MQQNKLIVTRAPHFFGTLNTTTIMRDVLIALLPEIVLSTIYLGWGALFHVLVCVASCVGFEWAMRRILHRKQTVKDLSAAVTGVILACLLPVRLPYYMAVLGCFIAIVIVKQLFGGLGQNFANPAATAWIALLLSFPTRMTVDNTPIELYTNAGDLPSNLIAFMGPVEGYIGQISMAALLLGGIYLVARKIIEPTIPLCYMATVGIISLIMGIDPVFQICVGGVIFGAFYMATDPVTTPALFPGKIIFGIGCGVFTMIMRIYCTFPSSMPFAILLMNIFTPHIDRFMRYLQFRKEDRDEAKLN